MTRRRILIADDHEDIREMWSMLLSDAGHEVHMAADGMAALAMVRTIRPDIAILDVNLPHLSGLEVARRLRQELGRNQLVLVAFTGDASDAVRQRSLEAGFDCHFVNPARFDKRE